MVWYGVIRRGVVWYGLFLYGMEWYRMSWEIRIDSQSQDMANNPSIEAIKENSPEQGYSSFNFKPVDQLLVSKSIKKLNPKKATGVDQLPA